MKPVQPRFELWHTIVTLAALFVAGEVCALALAVFIPSGEFETPTQTALITGGAISILGLLAIAYLVLQLLRQMKLLTRALRR